MSQPELVARLREARPAATPELRERVRSIAAEAPSPPHRRVTWRRAVVIAVPVAAAIAAAVVLLPSSGNRPSPVAVERVGAAGAPTSAQHAFALTPSAGGAASAAPAPSPTRAQRYSATLELELRSPAAVSDATKRATQIAASLAGYPLRLAVHTGASPSYADLVFRIPRAHVQDAVRRFAALGRILDEDVSIQDLQSQVNATAALIARLERQLAVLYRQTQTAAVKQHVAALTARAQRLQRAQASTLHAAHYATVELRMTARVAPPPSPARHGHGPLHGLGIAFHWLWIGAVYALALVAPLAFVVLAFWLALRALRRHREDALLSRS